MYHIVAMSAITEGNAHFMKEQVIVINISLKHVPNSGILGLSHYTLEWTANRL